MNVPLKITSGRFLIKTAETPEEIHMALLLRYQVFQVEMVGQEAQNLEDTDEYDSHADHLLVYDSKSEQLIATSRLNCTLFAKRFYTESEFSCETLMKKPGVKLEIGRVCVHHQFRKGIVLILLWRAIAEYMQKTNSELLFGCGSVATTEPREAAVIYKYLIEENKVRLVQGITPLPKFASATFEQELARLPDTLLPEDRELAATLLPPLCKSYFDIGCYVPGPPAFDLDFKCIDFLTVLEVGDLDPRLKKKMMGDTP